LRVVHAVQVFRVEEWYWHYDDGDKGIATSWQNLGLGWTHVYTDLAFVEARGLSQLFPTDKRKRHGPPLTNVDPCVNVENREIQSAMDLPRNNVPVEAAISRSEL
jgi:hypothetical protein